MLSYQLQENLHCCNNGIIILLMNKYLYKVPIAVQCTHDGDFQWSRLPARWLDHHRQNVSPSCAGILHQQCARILLSGSAQDGRRVSIRCLNVAWPLCSASCSALRGLVGSALNHRSLPPQFEYQRRHIWRVFHLRLRFINFGGRSAYLAYRVHTSCRKTPITILQRACESHVRSRFVPDVDTE